jgi:hypothetical protein
VPVDCTLSLLRAKTENFCPLEDAYCITVHFERRGMTSCLFDSYEICDTSLPFSHFILITSYWPTDEIHDTDAPWQI